MSIVLKYGMQVRTVILNFASKQNSNFQKSFGSVHYNTQVVKKLVQAVHLMREIN